MRKYQHVAGQVEGGRITCTECGAVLDENLRSDVPCSIPTTSLGETGGLLWFINVYNCRAELMAQDAVGRYYTCECDAELEEKIQEMIEEAVNEQGSITWSGMYSVPDGLLELISESIAAGKLKAVAVK